MSSATFWWMTELAKRVSAADDAVDADLGVGARRRCEHPLQHALGEIELAHARTPTRTLRKRPGAAGWPVWPVWPGWPLPQLGVPHDTVSDDSMSSERQNCGPDAGVRRVAQQPAELAVLDLVADLGAELEVEPLVVDRPRAVGLHVDAVVGGGDDLLERVRARLEADVGHPHHRQPGPAIGAHAAGVVEPGDGGRVAAGQHADPRAVAHGVARRGGGALVVEAERPERAGDRRVDRDVHQLRAVLQRADLGQVEPGRAGVGGLPAEDAVELDGVPDRLVDLQRHLLAAEDQRRLAARARRRRQQRPGLLGDTGRVGLDVDLGRPAPSPACRTGPAPPGTSGAASRRRRSTSP